MEILDASGRVMEARKVDFQIAGQSIFTIGVSLDDVIPNAVRDLLLLFPGSQ